ncbi:chalcone isomerase [Coccomyxa subellipsoidea C-169]|uniref:Chalcone isomerase n=1 Tax=Coccomyxa subellipsoidea (strain C-169) TaxID=574566 RepID=I0YR06_COCSC|nr:chalcone isomerase [Coccomyxa subellipsoidea C-169]EIE20825.1 chalcone isomerase [Coccomyxa subellipsoidea C-169]|eukprot:XP_005645369.1 chalcone isomerase [Coccomyxa subellipsoidea C-169]
MERKIGIEFPETFCHISQKDCPALIGTGARAKKLAGLKNIDVYAMGFYIDSRAAKQELGRDFDCLPPVSLEHNQVLAERLKTANNIEKTVRIVVTSGMVNQSRFSKGLRESLEPRLKQTGDTAALDEFEALFKGAQFYKGLEMSFTNTKNGSLALRIGNKEVGQVHAPGFTRAFFDLYLGTDPVSPDGKASIAKGLAAVISKAGS